MTTVDKMIKLLAFLEELNIEVSLSFDYKNYEHLFTLDVYNEDTQIAVVLEKDIVEDGCDYLLTDLLKKRLKNVETR